MRRTRPLKSEHASPTGPVQPRATPARPNPSRPVTAGGERGGRREAGEVGWGGRPGWGLRGGAVFFFLKKKPQATSVMKTVCF